MDKNKFHGKSDEEIRENLDYNNVVKSGSRAIKDLLNGIKNIEINLDAVRRSEKDGPDDYLKDVVKNWLNVNKEKINLIELEHLCEVLHDFHGRLSLILGELKIEKEQEIIQREKDTDPIFSPKKAGEYIAEVIGRDKPITKASVNKYIEKGKLEAFQEGTYNKIYKSDLDKFINKTDFRNT